MAFPLFIHTSTCLFPLHLQVTTVTVKNAHIDTAIFQLVIDFYYANRNTTTTVLCHRKNRSPSRINKTGISIRRVAAMHKITFLWLQRAIVAGGKLQTCSEAHEAEMVLSIAGGGMVPCDVQMEISCLARYS